MVTNSYQKQVWVCKGSRQPIAIHCMTSLLLFNVVYTPVETYSCTEASKLLEHVIPDLVERIAEYSS